MDAKELRIGNYVKYYGNEKAFKIEQINTIKTEAFKKGYVCSEKGYTHTDIQCLEPIKLTGDWLIKFGLNNEDTEIKDYGIIFIDEEMKFNITGFESPIYGNCFSKQITFVHELQNLYFFLTGYELCTKNIR